MSTLTRVVVDTSTLEAVCKTDFSEPVFRHLPLCTTDICYEELNRNKSTSSDYTRKKAIDQIFDHRREYGTPDLIPTDMEYDPYIDDQGEDSLIRVLDVNPNSPVKYILLFDFSASDDIEDVIDPDEVEVNTPGRAFELVWQGDFIQESTHHEALRQIAEREGWEGEALVEDLPETDYDDVF